MQNGDEKPTRTSEHLSDLLHRSQGRFGELLREVCEVSGFTQGKLSREAKEERRQMLLRGDIRPEDPIGSMEQPTISKVMAGTQEPTYYQVYIWLQVIRKHYEDPKFALICKELHIPLPVFSYELEQELWQLASFIPPNMLHQVYEDTKEKKLFKIYKPLIEHKEQRWEKTKRKSLDKEISTGRRAVANAKNVHKTARV